MGISCAHSGRPPSHLKVNYCSWCDYQKKTCFRDFSRDLLLNKEQKRNSWSWNRPSVFHKHPRQWLSCLRCFAKSTDKCRFSASVSTAECGSRSFGRLGVVILSDHFIPSDRLLLGREGRRGPCRLCARPHGWFICVCLPIQLFCC